MPRTLQSNMLFILIPAGCLALLVVLIMMIRSGEKTPIVLGALLTLSTDAGPAQDGLDLRNGLELAVEELNSRDGIQGHPVVIEIRDVHSDPDVAMQEYADMEQMSAPLVTYSMFSHVSMAVADSAEQNQAPLIALVTAVEAITKDRQWVFRYWAGINEHTEALSNMILGEHLHSVGIVYVDTVYGLSLSQNIEQRLTRQGMQVEMLSFAAADQGFVPDLTPVLPCQGVLIIGFSSHYVPILDALREQGYAGVRMGASGACIPEFMDLPQFQNMLVDAPQIYNPRMPYPAAVRKRYEDYYSLPFSYYSAMGYDIVMLTASLLQYGDLDRVSFKDSFEQGFVYPGLFGDINNSPGSHTLAFPLSSARIENGGLVYLEN